MFSSIHFRMSFFQPSPFRAALAVVIFLFASAPVFSQSNADGSICRAYEHELRNLEYNIRLDPKQAKRYQQLSQMQQQANRDAKRYSCNPGLFTNGSSSEVCRYIRTSQHRIERAMQQIAHSAITTRQRHLRQAIYSDMHRYNCRSPQELQLLMKENQAVARKRNKQTYKKQKNARHTELQQLPAAPAANINSTADLTPVKAYTNGDKSPFVTLAEPEPKQTKAAEKSPPLIQQAIDYVPDPTIRRVGPAYYPAQ